MKFYDRRALSKFSEGEITAQIMGVNERSEGPTIARLWSGAHAAPEDLIRQMDGPFQHRAEMQMWGTRQIMVPLSDTLVMISPVLERRPDVIPNLADPKIGA